VVTPAEGLAYSEMSTPAVRKDATFGAPATASRKIYDVGSTSVGTWSCTPGSWSSVGRPRASTEAFVILEGSCFLTNEDGTSVRCMAGDTVVLPKGWEGYWDVTETIRKVWVIADGATPYWDAPRRPIVGGNWKCNPEKFSDLPGLIANINACDTSACDVYVCPSNLHIGAVYDQFTNGAHVAPQNCNFKGCGAYTGEMAVEQMRDMGMQWVLIGHSERRGEFGLPTPAESNTLLASKLEHILDNGLKCILAIGEPLPVREQGIEAVMGNLIPQLAEVKHLLDPEKVVIAYEPVWSIGTGVTASPEQAQETHAAIRQWISDTVSPAVAAGIRIQYGGSANAANAAALAACPDVDGFLVGGASLKPEFADIVAAISTAKAAAPAATPDATSEEAARAAWLAAQPPRGEWSMNNALSGHAVPTNRDVPAAYDPAAAEEEAAKQAWLDRLDTPTWGARY
jgi:triosephosphate isomerase